MTTKSLARLISVIALSFSAAAALGQSSDPPPAKPIDPVEGILEAFKDHAIVALGEGAHGNLNSHEFRLRLIRDPRFPETVNDIVVESGNALHQETMDRFVAGESVSESDLRKTWQDTTQASGLWDVPIYEEFFRAVRAANESLPKGKKLRVLLGDPPIDWNRVATPDDVAAFLAKRDEHPVAVIRNEVLAKHRRALVVYGDIHFLRRSLYFPLPDQQDAEATYRAPLNSLVGRLEREASMKVFSIFTAAKVADWRSLQSDIPDWRVPSLTRTAGTKLGAQPFVALSPGVRMFRMVEGTRRGFNPDPVRSHRIEDQFDAVLILGVRDQERSSQRPPQLCGDKSYMEMRLERIRIASPALLTGSPALLADPGAWLKRECAAVLATH